MGGVSRNCSGGNMEGKERSVTTEWRGRRGAARGKWNGN